MYLLLLLFPLLGVLCVGILGFWFGRTGSIMILMLYIFFTWLLSLFIFFEVCICKSVATFNLYTWVLIDIYQLNFGFLFDNLSSLMCVIVCTISLLVHIYSLGYMSHDPYLIRFLAFLSLFTFSMLIVVISNNFIQLFLGWELLVFALIF